MAKCIFFFLWTSLKLDAPLNVTWALLFFSYLLNPYTVMSCVAKSTCAINNSVIAFFILATIKGNAVKEKNVLYDFLERLEM